MQEPIPYAVPPPKNPAAHSLTPAPAAAASTAPSLHPPVGAHASRAASKNQPQQPTYVKKPLPQKLPASLSNAYQSRLAASRGATAAAGSGQAAGEQKEEHGCLRVTLGALLFAILGLPLLLLFLPFAIIKGCCCPDPPTDGQEQQQPGPHNV